MVGREEEYHRIKKNMAIMDLHCHIENQHQFDNQEEWWCLYCDKHYMVEFYEEEELCLNTQKNN